MFARVIVSTEDKEIAAISLGCNAEVAARPLELAEDNVGVVDVCLNLLDQEEKAGRSYDIMCCLYATSPLRTADDIKHTVSLVESGKCDYAMAVTTYDMPPHQALKMDAHGALEPIWPDLVNKREQEIGELYVDNGSTYAVSVLSFRKDKTFYGPGLMGYCMPSWRSIDINVPDDLYRAEYFAEKFGL